MTERKDKDSKKQSDQTYMNNIPKKDVAGVFPSPGIEQKEYFDSPSQPTLSTNSSMNNMTSSLKISDTNDPPTPSTVYSSIAGSGKGVIRNPISNESSSVPPMPEPAPSKATPETKTEPHEDDTDTNNEPLVTLRERLGERNKILYPLKDKFSDFYQGIESLYENKKVYISFLVDRATRSLVPLSSDESDAKSDTIRVYEYEILDDDTYTIFKNKIKSDSVDDPFLVISIGEYVLCESEEQSVKTAYGLVGDRLMDAYGGRPFDNRHIHSPDTRQFRQTQKNTQRQNLSNKIFAQHYYKMEEYTDRDIPTRGNTSPYATSESEYITSGEKDPQAESETHPSKHAGSDGESATSDNEGSTSTKRTTDEPKKKKRKRVNYVIQYINSRAQTSSGTTPTGAHPMETGSSIDSPGGDSGLSMRDSYFPEGESYTNTTDNKSVDTPSSSKDVTTEKSAEGTKAIIVKCDPSNMDSETTEEGATTVINGKNMLQAHSELLKSGAGKDHKMISVLYRQITLQESVQHAFDALDDHYKMKFICLRKIGEILFGDSRYVMNPLQVLCPLCLSPIKLTTLCDKRMGNLMNKKHHMCRNHLRGEPKSGVVIAANALLERWEILMRGNFTRMVTLDMLDMVELPEIPPIAKRSLLSPDLFVNRLDYVDISRSEELRLINCMNEISLGMGGGGRSFSSADLPSPSEGPSTAGYYGHHTEPHDQPYPPYSPYKGPHWPHYPPHSSMYHQPHHQRMHAPPTYHGHPQQGAPYRDRHSPPPYQGYDQEHYGSRQGRHYYPERGDQGYSGRMEYYEARPGSGPSHQPRGRYNDGGHSYQEEHPPSHPHHT